MVCVQPPVFYLGLQSKQTMLSDTEMNLLSWLVVHLYSTYLMHEFCALGHYICISPI